MPSSSPSSSSTILRWLQRKRYQYEVTFSLYMLTPIEKFIFNSFLFLFLSMIIIAASLYLPHHIKFLVSRAWFYYAGDEVTSVTAAVAAGAATVATHTARVLHNGFQQQHHHQQHQKPMMATTSTVGLRGEL
ncbi:MAG: hypothetical protein M4579_003634 [Chaenotheca gracillima]|nr:MAG: hypothetical protein M4579_003634 [Chaenotheca gracillima]